MIDKISSFITYSNKKLANKKESTIVASGQALSRDVFLKDNSGFVSKPSFQLKVFSLLEVITSNKIFKRYKPLEFAPAKTLEEGYENIKKLGVKKIDLGENESIDVLNYFIEGLTIYNNAHCGKARMPKEISFSMMPNPPLMSAYPSSKQKKLTIYEYYFGRQFINDQIDLGIERSSDLFLESSDDNQIRIPVFFASKDERKHAENLINRFCKDNDSLDFGEKVELLTILSYLPEKGLEFYIDAKEYSRKLFKRDDFLKDCDAHVKEMCLKNILESKTNHEAHFYLDEVLKNNDETLNMIFSKKKFQTLFHELAHFQDYSETRMPLIKNSELYHMFLEDWGNDIEKVEIASLVSEYAKSDPDEFIAETYSLLLCGEKLPKEVLELYKKMKGPSINGVI